MVGYPHVACFFVLWVFGWSNRELPIFGPRNGDLLYATGTRGLTVVELLPKSQTASLRNRRFGPHDDIDDLTRHDDTICKDGGISKKNSFILISSVSIPAQISLRDHHGDMMKLDLVAIGVSHVFPMGPWAGRYYLVVWRLVTSHILYHHISSFSLDNPLST